MLSQGGVIEEIFEISDPSKRNNSVRQDDVFIQYFSRTRHRQDVKDFFRKAGHSKTRHYSLKPTAANEIHIDIVFI